VTARALQQSADTDTGQAYHARARPLASRFAVTMDSIVTTPDGRGGR
jgi:hypothetical protein